MEMDSLIDGIKFISLGTTELQIITDLEIVLYDDPTNKINFTIPSPMEFYVFYDEDGYNIYSGKQIENLCGQDKWWQKFFTKHKYIDRVYELCEGRDISNFLGFLVYKLCPK